LLALNCTARNSRSSPSSHLLLIGIVKKNGIMLVDSRYHAQRERGSTCMRGDRGGEGAIPPDPDDDAGGDVRRVPLAFATGVGAEMRRRWEHHRLRLLLSQILTLYTTPVIYRDEQAATQKPVSRPSARFERSEAGSR